ncbi:winged helix-turn-helix domain-containing protein [Rubrivivax albus]|uniref:Winged helix family transcriptional regulator n=1 Tax=Rubrivivax albus TaxID=2499835 RepID=A0A437JT51_9BURK|nr:winged helix-turn-helix domain-containing protein [Rubrivivax albus]RVT50113.1 winged helix family transcriptional regulator [Rubrivivax albus]
MRAHLQATDYGACTDAALRLRWPTRIDDDDGLWLAAAWAIAEGFGLPLPSGAAGIVSWIGVLLAGEADTALDRASPEAVLAWCTAAGEWCERHGLDAPFARLSARAAAADAQAPAWARVHWRIASAWHHEAFGRFVQVGELLDEAAALAATAGDPGLVIVVSLKQARLALSRARPAEALLQAEAVAARLVPGGAPLWWADLADIRARAALAQGDPVSALHQARLCDGLARQAGATPAYTVTYRVNEAYALLGQGAVDDAVALVCELAAVPMPPRLQQRVALLARLFTLARDDRAGRWDADQDAALETTVQRLRALDWTGVLALLPAVVARLWARALEAGIEPDWVHAAITSRALPPPEPCWPDAWPWPLRLQVLGGFTWQRAGDGDAATQGGRAALKPIELLSRLAAEAGLAPMPAETLAQALWPGEGREGRDKALETTLARLRRLIGDAAALRLAERRLRLDPQHVWLDRAALERRLSLIDAAVCAGSSANGPPVAVQWNAALDLWRGPLLADAGDDDAVPDWLLQARTRLRQRMAASLLGSAGVSGHPARCLRAVAADPGLGRWLGPLLAAASA